MLPLVGSHYFTFCLDDDPQEEQLTNMLQQHSRQQKADKPFPSEDSSQIFEDSVRTEDSISLAGKVERV